MTDFSTDMEKSNIIALGALAAAFAAIAVWSCMTCENILQGYKQLPKWGISAVGAVFLLMLFIPNIIWGRNQPKGYEEAAKRENKVLYMHRDDLELDEDTYFIQDLIGLEVRDADTQQVYGKIADVMQTGANDVYVIKGEDREYLVPAIADVVVSTDVDGGVMTIRPLDGLFD